MWPPVDPHVHICMSHVPCLSQRSYNIYHRDSSVGRAADRHVTGAWLNTHS